MAPLYDEPWGRDSDASFIQDDPDYPKRYLELALGAEYSWDATKGEEFDLRAYALSMGARVPLPWGWSFDAQAIWEWEHYLNGSLVDFHRRGRRDFIQDYELALSRTFVLKEGQPEHRYSPDVDRVLMTLRAFARWTLDDSNVVDRLRQTTFEYDRGVYGMTLSFSFN